MPNDKKLTSDEALKEAVRCYKLQSGTVATWAEVATTNNVTDGWNRPDDIGHIRDTCFDVNVKRKVPAEEAEPLRAMARKKAAHR